MDPSSAPPSPEPSEPGTSGMNRYGRQAMQHWATYLPDRYSQIPDPTGFFTMMGREMAEEIADLSAQLAIQQPQEPTYLGEVGRLNRLRSQAEEQVLNERVFGGPQTAPETGPTERP